MLFFFVCVSVFFCLASLFLTPPSSWLNAVLSYRSSNANTVDFAHMYTVYRYIYMMDDISIYKDPDGVIWQSDQLTFNVILLLVASLSQFGCNWMIFYVY